MSGERNILAEQAGMNDIQNDAERRAQMTGMSSPVGMVDMSAITAGAATAEASLTAFMKFEPMVASMVGMFFPPAAIAQPFIVMAMPFLIRALDDIAKSNGGDMVAAFLELANHLTAGKPISPVLAGPMAGPPVGDGLDPSRQGSG